MGPQVKFHKDLSGFLGAQGRKLQAPKSLDYVAWLQWSLFHSWILISIPPFLPLLTIELAVTTGCGTLGVMVVVVVWVIMASFSVTCKSHYNFLRSSLKIWNMHLARQVVKGWEI